MHKKINIVIERNGKIRTSTNRDITGEQRTAVCNRYVTRGMGCAVGGGEAAKDDKMQCPFSGEEHVLCVRACVLVSESGEAYG